MYQQIQNQSVQIKKMEELIVQLKDRLKELEDIPRTNIEKIEYNFDQLKVETLEGTLNIGITPNGTDSIEQLAVNQTSSTEGTDLLYKYPELYPNIQQRLNNFLTKDCYKLIEDMEEKYKYQLDDPYRSFIIKDIQKQLGNRIQYYLGEEAKRDLNGDQDHIENMIIVKVTEDIKKAIEAFVKNLPKEEDKKG